MMIREYERFFYKKKEKKRNENKTKITMKLQIYFLTNCKDKKKQNEKTYYEK